MNLEQQLINVTELYLAKLKECEDLKRRNAKLRKQFEEAVTQPEKVYVQIEPDLSAFKEQFKNPTYKLE